MAMAPTGLYGQLTSYFKDAEETVVPPLSLSTLMALSIAYTVLYVLPFYLSPTTRPSPALSRDAPSVIRARIRFVTVSVSACTVATAYILSAQTRASWIEILRLLAWYPLGLPEIAKTLLLTAMLFAGPLFEKAIVEGRWKDWIEGQPLYESLSSWMGFRNFVAGPITEELLFRSLLVPLHLLTTLSAAHIVLLTPLYFGIAHIHHFYEFTLTHPHTPLLPALLRSLVQFTYTTVFGWYATFVFLRTGNVVAVILVHTFCNWCGLPRLWGRVEPRVAMGGPATRGKEYDRTALGKGSKTKWFWSIAYYLLLIAGAVGFQQGLWTLTESRRALAKFG